MKNIKILFVLIAMTSCESKPNITNDNKSVRYEMSKDSSNIYTSSDVTTIIDSCSFLKSSGIAIIKFSGDNEYMPPCENGKLSEITGHFKLKPDTIDNIISHEPIHSNKLSLLQDSSISRPKKNETALVSYINKEGRTHIKSMIYINTENKPIDENKINISEIENIELRLPKEFEELRNSLKKSFENPDSACSSSRYESIFSIDQTLKMFEVDKKACQPINHN